MKRYLGLWLGLTALLLLVVATFSFIVDPYGLFRVVDNSGFNGVKPAAGGQGAMAKAYQVLRLKPRGLILGNSRAEVGFNPVHPAWPASAQPVFNLALPGTDTETSLHYLQHILANPDAPKPEVIIWGVDFMDFLVDPATPYHAGEEPRGKSRLLTNPDGSSNHGRWLYETRDYARSTLTLTAFLDSVRTLASQKNPYAENLTPQGFNPMQDYLKIAADEGYWKIFRQKDKANTHDFLRRPDAIFNADGRSSGALEDLRRILTLCRQKGIKLHLVIYPYHAHLQEIFRITGHWKTFEMWKREIVNIVAQEARSSESVAFPLWDFSGFNELTTEAIPEKGDRKTKMQFYWEAGHFKAELGDLVQDRVLGNANASLQFGVQLSPGNVEQQIELIRAQEADYRQSHPRDIEDLTGMAAEMRSHR